MHIILLRCVQICVSIAHCLMVYFFPGHSVSSRLYPCFCAAASSSSIACGVRPLGRRIIGGREAKPHSWPWQCSLQHSGQHICGCSIATPSWIITAAHCMYVSTRLVETRARQHGQSWRVMETGHPSTRAVNSGRQLGQWKPGFCLCVLVEICMKLLLINRKI